MTQSKFHKTLLSLFFITAFAFIFSPSCKRNKDSKVVINVVCDTSNAPVAGAKVHMYPPSSTNANLTAQDQTDFTDASGSVSFTFKLPALLQVDVTSNRNGSGSALIKMEEGRQVSKTIKVN